MMNSTNRDEYAPSQSPLRVLAGSAVIPTPTAEQSDQQLVQACLGGDQSAWAALIRRYQNVVYFFARRYGASATDAADVFQLVCAEIFVSLPRLRNQASLRSWIMTVSARQAYHWKRGHLKRAQREGADPDVAFNTAEHAAVDRARRAATHPGHAVGDPAVAPAVPGAGPAAVLRGPAAPLRRRRRTTGAGHGIDRPHAIALPEEAPAHSRHGRRLRERRVRWRGRLLCSACPRSRVLSTQ